MFPSPNPARPIASLPVSVRGFRPGIDAGDCAGCVGGFGVDVGGFFVMLVVRNAGSGAGGGKISDNYSIETKSSHTLRISC